MRYVNNIIKYNITNLVKDIASFVPMSNIFASSCLLVIGTVTNFYYICYIFIHWCPLTAVIKT